MLPFTIAIAPLVSLVSALSHEDAVNSLHHVREDSAIEWSKCTLFRDLEGDCGRMMVPLDYTDQESPGLEIQILRIAATKRPRKGSIFLNFGGPGASGHQNLEVYGPNMLE